MSSGREFEFIVFGATGYTGQFVVEELGRVALEENNVTWAIAGRNKTKLKACLEEAGKHVKGFDFDEVPIMVADVSDAESINKMAARCRVVINCVGPYRFWGDQVVRACVANGTHHVDISGEPQYLESMVLQYGDKAKESGSYIVGACGLDSIPCDVGCTYLQQNFDGDLNSIESYLCIHADPSLSMRNRIHYGTYQSAIHGIAHWSELRGLREKLYPVATPKPSHKLKPRSTIHHSTDVNGWCLPFPGSDRAIVRRTQYTNYVEHNRKPAQMYAYFKGDSLLACIVTIIAAAMFGLMASFKLGRKFLENYPRLCTFGFVSHAGPNRKDFDKTTFSMKFIGKGWKEKLSDPQQQHTTPPDHTMVTEVRGPEPGYISTAIMITQSALTLIKPDEKNNLPASGGVYTTGYAFQNTRLIHNLNRKGIKFQIL